MKSTFFWYCVSANQARDKKAYTETNTKKNNCKEMQIFDLRVFRRQMREKKKQKQAHKQTNKKETKIH